MKKILASLSIIAATGAIAAGGTFAVFSDTETSTGNTFTAGTLNLRLASDTDHNGLADGGTFVDGSNLAGLFSMSNVAPGATSVNSVILNNNGSIAGTHLAFKAANLQSHDVTCEEPEQNDIDSASDYMMSPVNGTNHPETGVWGTIGTPGTSSTDFTTGLCDEAGELGSAATVTAWIDLNSDGVQDGGETTLVGFDDTNNNGIQDGGEAVASGLAATYDLGSLAAGASTTLSVQVSVPSNAGNEIMSDSLSFDGSFALIQ